MRGKGLGGSSVVNGMIAIHAMADDYERWAAYGCPGWSFEDILPVPPSHGDRPELRRRALPRRPTGRCRSLRLLARVSGARSTTRSPRPPRPRVTAGARTTTRRPAPVSRRMASTRATARA